MQLAASQPKLVKCTAFHSRHLHTQQQGQGQKYSPTVQMIFQRECEPHPASTYSHLPQPDPASPRGSLSCWDSVSISQFSHFHPILHLLQTTHKSFHCLPRMAISGRTDHLTLQPQVHIKRHGGEPRPLWHSIFQEPRPKQQFPSTAFWNLSDRKKRNSCTTSLVTPMLDRQSRMIPC